MGREHDDPEFYQDSPSQRHGWSSYQARNVMGGSAMYFSFTCIWDQFLCTLGNLSHLGHREGQAWKCTRSRR